MYVASRDDRLWLQIVQRKLYTRSRVNPDYVFEKLWGLVTDPRNLRIALARVHRNRGARTAGIDRITVRHVLLDGAEPFLDELRKELRGGTFRPMPVRRVLIPKAGKPGKFRPLGIPTVKDRVVQAAVKNILEPIFEADFYPVSHGFRPGRSVHGAIAHLKVLMHSRGADPLKREDLLPFQWTIEGDIKGCFDNIGHHGLMERVRRRVGDAKLSRLVLAFLKAGALAEAQFLRSDSGTPQGGILSPLLANVALSVIEDRYERHVWPRGTAIRSSRVSLASLFPADPDVIARRAYGNRTRDKRRGLPVFTPVRYADDFIVLVAKDGDPQDCRQSAEQEKAALARELESKLGLSLSEEKTLVTPVTSTMRFLGHHLRVRKHPRHGGFVPLAVIPKEQSKRLRQNIKDIFRRSTCRDSLENRLRLINPVVRGWANFYKHAWGAKRVFAANDHYVWWTIYRWLRKKHPNTRMRDIYARYGWRKPRGRAIRWRDRETHSVTMSPTRVRPFCLSWQKTPAFVPSLWRARCVSKGARRVRRGAAGNSLR
ncbi:group II intron reverse transcriptase/maturase [Pendulispora rubella]|uniref:Group II intron reverse transcriptase/maturase n=2 Tax=Pendulispora rubella TaxID=2741070 RepID=A0ABZ2LMG7_9BACT